jgi:hypothetical protein
MTSVVADGPAKVPFSAYVADYMKHSPDFLEGIEAGVKAAKEGRVRRWADVKKDLGLD